jgi:SHS2 domain-containing protein
MYEVFEHTADLGLRIRAASREQLFSEAARALLSVFISNPDSVQLLHTHRVRVNGSSPDFLLLDWLSELLYLFDTQQLLLAEFLVEFDADGLTVRCRGEPLDVARHRLEHEVKAITYHGLKVESVAGVWLAEVILDI